jgi:hypothetical protein
MRSSRFGLLLSFLILYIPAWAQQTQTATPPSVTNDPQAVSVLNQALAVAGGISAISAVSDYVGTGTITYYLPKSDVGGVTVRANWLDQLRIDSTLSGGLRSEIVNPGSTSSKRDSGVVIVIPGDTPMSPGRILLPHLLLAQAASVPAGSTFPGYEISYKGNVQIESHLVQDIQIQFVLPGFSESNYQFAKCHTIDVFIDTVGLPIMTQEELPGSVVRQIRYANYRPVNGILVPFSVSETISGVQIWLIQLDKINFNTGLLDSDFQL